MAKATVSIGIDPSIKATGLVILESTGVPIPKVLVEEEIRAAADLEGIARVQEIAVKVMTRIHEFKPDEIVIEGYSLNTKNASSIIPLCELGGVLRLMMHLDGLRWRDPQAGKLKKFVMGNGSAQKDQMMMFVLKRWGHVSKTNNTADAYGLACIGLATRNLLPGISVEMRQVAGDLPLKGS